ncbi:hypothetical protein NUSPORA_02395 [Nucleospora cyclopteri]
MTVEKKKNSNEEMAEQKTTKNEFLIDGSDEESSSSVNLIVDKAEEGELQIEQMQENNVYDIDLANIGDKPWLKPGADITDYFNYGFTEKTWEKYCEMQKNNRVFAEKYKYLEPVSRKESHRGGDNYRYGRGNQQNYGRGRNRRNYEGDSDSQSNKRMKYGDRRRRR